MKKTVMINFIVCLFYANYCKSQTGGLGVKLDIQQSSGFPFITEVIKGSPAEQAHLQPNDFITKIDFVTTQNLSIEAVSGKLRGAVGTTCCITIWRDSKEYPISFVRSDLDALAGSSSSQNYSSTNLGYPFVQTVSVSSVTAYSSSHAVIKYDVPTNAIGCIVRFITKSKGEKFDEPSLSSLLALLPRSEFTQAANLAKFALGNSDDNDVNFNVMTTKEDADAFTNTFFYHYSCKTLEHTVSACFFYNECLNNTIYFGVENNNYFKGVNVQVEIVPVYDNDPSKNYAHSFTLQVHNDEKQDLSLEIGDENESNWYSVSLDASSWYNLQVNTPKVHLRIETSGIYKKYYFNTSERASLYWNETEKRHGIR